MEQPPIDGLSRDLEGNSGLQQSIHHVSATHGGRVFAGLNVHGNLITAGVSLKDQIVSWLNPIDHTLIHESLVKDRSPKTGDWFLAELQTWIGSCSRLAWVVGQVGCGKSTLCSLLIDYIRGLIGGRTHDHALVYFYCTFRDPRTFELDALLKSLIVQLYHQHEGITSVIEMYEKNKPYQPSGKQLKDVLLSNFCSTGRSGDSTDKDSALFKSITIVLDGLDEVPSGSHRDALLSFIGDVLQLESPQLSLVIVSREEADIKEGLVTAKDWTYIKIPSGSIDGDIGAYVDDQIANGRKLKTLRADVKSKIRETLTSTSKGMFRLAALQMQELAKMSRGLNTKAIYSVLKGLPRELDDYYDAIVMRIPDVLRGDLFNAAQWLVFATRPMLIEEMVEACAMGTIGPEQPVRYDSDRCLEASEICEYLSGMVSLDPPYSFDDGPIPLRSHTLILSHYSVQEYLFPTISLNRPAGLWRFNAELAHRFIGQACIAYIHYCCTQHPGSAAELPLKGYAWLSWAVHLNALESRSVEARVQLGSLKQHNSIAFPILYQDGGLESERTRFQLFWQSVLPANAEKTLYRALKDPTFPEHLQDASTALAFRPLGDCPRTVRLLMLHPSRTHSTQLTASSLNSSLTTDSLDNHPHYIALSYTWGYNYSHEKLSITVNGQRYAIGGNLYRALLNIRHVQEPIVLWVDTLCISMQDLEERSSQIRLMVQIYGSAWKTLVYLTEFPKGSESAAVAMDLLIDENIRKWLNPNEMGISLVQELLRALQLFFEQPNWSRSWTIQEIVVAKNVTVQCGNKEIPWDSMVDIAELRSFLESVLFTDAISFAESPSEVFGRAWDAIAAIQFLRKKRLSGDDIPLPELLYASRYHEASDPRDRIYAILSLVSEDQKVDPLLRPDYSRSMVEVYTKMGVYLLRQHRNLDLLCFACPWAEHWDGLPAWTPTWGSDIIEPFSAALSFSDRPSLYSAGTQGLSSSETPLQISLDMRTLTVSGFLLSRVNSIVTLQTIQNFEYDWQSLILEMIPKIRRVDWSAQDDRFAGQDISTRCSRTYCADQIMLPGGEVQRLGTVVPPHTLLEQSKRLWIGGSWQSLSRQMFVSDKGHIGLGPAWAKVGDVIVVLLGASVPFILRPNTTNDLPIGNGSASWSKGTEYALVGEAYVDGIMDGEIFQEWREGRRQTQTFELS